MPASHHPVFKNPSDPSVPIWRYMDFTKFVAMLDSSALFFSRADTLGDPFEGSYSRANERARANMFDRLAPAALAEYATKQAETWRWMRQWTFISCWHMNRGESAAMWKLYAKTNEAVAIKSSFFRLANELDEKCYLGTVEYVDFEKDYVPEGNSFYPYVHKRLSFAHENEVRAVIQDFPIRNEAMDWSAIPPVGMERKVNLSQLVETVYVAPTCAAWFKGIVSSVCGRFGLKKPIVQSSLDAEPFF